MGVDIHMFVIKDKEVLKLKLKESVKKDTTVEK